MKREFEKKLQIEQDSKSSYNAEQANVEVSPKFGMTIFDEFQNLSNDFASLLHNKDYNDFPDFDDLKKKYQEKFKNIQTV